MPDINKLLTEPEGKTLEFKRDLSSLQPILKTLIAFANTSGGVLILGKEDQGSVVGIDAVFEAEERLANAISDAIAPQLMPDISIVTVGNVSLLVVSVEHGPGSFYLKAKGPQAGGFVRVGSTNRLASVQWLNTLRESTFGVAFDQRPCLGATQEDLDTLAIEKAFQRSIGVSELCSLHILVPYGKQLLPSQGGMILFGKGQARKKFFPSDDYSMCKISR